MRELLAAYAAKPPNPLTLSKLISFGHPLTPESVLTSMVYALDEIPKRLAMRVRALEALPFVVGTNPHVEGTLNAYRTSFEWLANYPRISTMEENVEFAEHLQALVESHAHDIPTMAKGFVIWWT
jgi:26S proteasome regulatory subunit T1